MSTEELRVSSLIAASPNKIYGAWMDERQHSAFTGGRATVDPWVGGRVTAWDGYIEGTHVQLDTGRRIIMTWRTTEFPLESPDSTVEVHLEPVAGGTRVTVVHTDIPEGQSDKYKKGWRSFYLDPMKKYFAKPGAARAAMRAASKAGLLPIPGVSRARPGHRRPIVKRKEEPAPEATEEVSASAPAEKKPAKKATKKKPAKKAAKKPAKKATKKKPTKKATKKKAPAKKKPAKKATKKKPAKKKTPAKKKATKKKPAKKKPAKKKPAKKATKKKAPAKKKKPAKKATKKKAPAKKKPAKKATRKKAPAKKKPAKKATKKKTPAKKKTRRR